MESSSTDFRARIRPKAICVFRNAGHILVIPLRDSGKQQDFCVTVGGGIEYGERSWETIIREVKEELGADISAVQFLGVLENIFIYEGVPGHELVFVYDATLNDATLYSKSILDGDEEGYPFKAHWQPLADFAPGRSILYPEGLYQLLTGSGK